MFIARNTNTGVYLGAKRIFNTTTSDKSKARIFRSVRGAKSALTYGLFEHNAHLLEGWEIIEVKVV